VVFKSPPGSKSIKNNVGFTQGFMTYQLGRISIPFVVILWMVFFWEYPISIQ
jgi:hypothetical protein